MMSIIRNFVIISIVLLIIFNRPDEVSGGEGENENESGNKDEIDTGCPDTITRYGFIGNEKVDCLLILDAAKYSDFLIDVVKKFKNHEERQRLLNEKVPERKNTAERLLNVIAEETDEKARKDIEKKLKALEEKEGDESDESFEESNEERINLKELFNIIDEKEKTLPKMLDQVNDFKKLIKNVIELEMANDTNNDVIKKEYNLKFAGKKKEFAYLQKYMIYIDRRVDDCSIYAPSETLPPSDSTNGMTSMVHENTTKEREGIRYYHTEEITSSPGIFHSKYINWITLFGSSFSRCF